MVLSNRLLMCASLVKGKIIADIGSDHAYIPIYLLENKKTDFIYVSDIVKGPLNNAKNNIIKYGFDKCTELILCNGLNNDKFNLCDEIIIAGMGGELIIDILNEADKMLFKSKKFILQPMTKSFLLRKYLYDNGFVIENDNLVFENKKFYEVMKAYYSPSISLKKYDFYDIYIGNKNTKDASFLLDYYINHFNKIIEIKRKQNINCDEERKILSNLLNRID